MLSKNKLIQNNYKNFIKNNNFLITGGTGSFGKAMVNFLLKHDVPEIRILSRDEKKQEDLRNELNDNRVKFYLGDVRDNNSLNDVFVNVKFVFHAAALKQVPSCEFFPIEAIKTNVHGTENVINQCIKNNISKMILLSTDKAVYPINSMGMTKALAEKIIISKARNLKKTDTILCVTRYGNVMGTRGSVIPLFVNQIKGNRSITMTDPNMTRFLMSLDESVDLVMHAFLNANQSEIFIRKANSAKINDIAIALKEIFNSSSKIKLIGKRHGEKTYESLISKEEYLRTKEEKDYYLIKPDFRDLNYNKFFNTGEKKLTTLSDYTSENTKTLSVKEIIKILLNENFIKKKLDN